MQQLPDLHKQALAFKNRKRLQRDGGRAWIKDSQLYEARNKVNGRLDTIRENLDKVTITRPSEKREFKL